MPCRIEVLYEHLAWVLQVAPQTVEELQEALSLACETLRAFTQDAHAFNRHFLQVTILEEGNQQSASSS